MEREKLIEAIVDSLEDWQDTDSHGFWDHVKQLEREYLRKKSMQELKELAEGITV